jgi:hypothetical protein
MAAKRIKNARNKKTPVTQINNIWTEATKTGLQLQLQQQQQRD